MESFFTNLIKRPVKLFMLCLVLYLASQSFLVGAFVTIVGLSTLYRRVFPSKKATVAASKTEVSEPASAPKGNGQPEAENEPYERSAVVTPIRRTGTHDRS